MRIPVSKPTPLQIGNTYHIVYPPWWAEESEMGVIKERDFLKEENSKLNEKLNEAGKKKRCQLGKNF